MKFPVPIPFAEHLGFELTHYAGGEARIECTLRAELVNSRAQAHGGVVMTLLDVVMAHAASSPDTPGDPPRSAVATIEMKTAFMRPGTGRLRAHGKVLHRTRSMAFCSADIYDEANQHVAHGSGTFKQFPKVPAAESTPAAG